MTPDLPLYHPASRRVAIFGAGKSGRAAAQLCASVGMNYQIYDEAGQGHATEFGAADVHKYDIFIFSPGFSADHPWLQLAKESDRLCFGELGFAMWLWRGKVLGVTGTNGKTTVTTLLKCALEALGQKAVTAGNIGEPLSELWLQHGLDDNVWAVCEISSFQAELPLGIELEGLIWTNFAEDHLDRYPSMEAYFKAKSNLLHCLQSGGYAVLGDTVKAWDANIQRFDAVCDTLQESALSMQSPFAHYPQVDNFRLVAELWAHLGLPAEALLAAANQFTLAPHRLSQVFEWRGVSFWDDSKATNFSAALAALDAVAGPIYWIAGGATKGGDLDAFALAAAAKVEALFAYGEVATQLERALSGVHPRLEVHYHFADAVKAATEAALRAAPATVLLSPGFASLDQFKSYAQRGESFISTVLSLKNSATPN